MGDANAAVDVYGNYSRQISPSGTPIEDLPGEALEADILKRMLDVREGEDLPIPFAQRSTARDAMAKAGRERWRQVLGDEADDICDAELVDHWNYAVFPNLHPWGGYNRIVYRFRPNGDRHNESIFEVMFLTPYRGERPPTAPVTELDFGDPWTNATELQTLGHDPADFDIDVPLQQYVAGNLPAQPRTCQCGDCLFGIEPERGRQGIGRNHRLCVRAASVFR